MSEITLHYTNHPGVQRVIASDGGCLQAQAILVDHLTRGHSVVVLDCECTYLKMAEALGGTYISLRQSPTGCYDGSRHGETPLVVYDFEQIKSAPYLLHELPVMAPLGEAPMLGLASAPDLVILNNAREVLRRFPAVLEIVQTWAAQGAAFCITGHSAEEVAAFGSLAAATQPPVFLQPDH